MGNALNGHQQIIERSKLIRRVFPKIHFILDEWLGLMVIMWYLCAFKVPWQQPRVNCLSRVAVTENWNVRFVVQSGKGLWAKSGKIRRTYLFDTRYVRIIGEIRREKGFFRILMKSIFDNSVLIMADFFLFFFAENAYDTPLYINSSISLSLVILGHKCRAVH